MPAKWTGEVIAKLHVNRIKQKELASRLGVTNEYVCMVLNSEKERSDMREKMFDAIESIIRERKDAESAEQTETV